MLGFANSCLLKVARIRNVNFLMISANINASIFLLEVDVKIKKDNADFHINRGLMMFQNKNGLHKTRNISEPRFKNEGHQV